MRTDIAYVNGLGERLELGGGDGDLHYFEHELRDWSWSYETGTGGGVSSFSRKPSKPREISLPVGIAADDGETGLELRNLVDRIGEHDISSKEPGRLYVGDWYMRCWIVGCEPTDYWMDDRFAEMDLTLLAADPSWIRETESRYVPETGADAGAGDDFPFEFPMDFKRERQSRQVYNGGSEPRDFLWRAYGPATDPAIHIGGNLYRVNVELAAGDRLEVDSTARTVLVTSSAGVVTQAYGDREPGAKGSGSYIFERVAPGSNTLAWDNSFTFDLVVYEKRTAPPWEVG